MSEIKLRFPQKSMPDKDGSAWVNLDLDKRVPFSCPFCGEESLDFPVVRYMPFRRIHPQVVLLWRGWGMDVLEDVEWLVHLGCHREECEEHWVCPWDEDTVRRHGPWHRSPIALALFPDRIFLESGEEVLLEKPRKSRRRRRSPW
jgi:hypothetical protein